MDGTLVDSTAGVVGAWSLFAKAYPGIDVHEILSCEDSFGFYLVHISHYAAAQIFQAHTASVPSIIFVNIVN